MKGVFIIEKKKTIITLNDLKREIYVSVDLFDKNGNLKTLKEQITDKNFKKSTPYLICLKMPEVTGNDYPIAINHSVIKKVKVNHHISNKFIYNIEHEIKKYTFISKSQNRDDSIIIFTNSYDQNKNLIMISLQLNKNIGAYYVNSITSIYGRNNYIEFIKMLKTRKKIIKKNQCIKSIGVHSSKG